ncbi:hypothetical protein FQA39_LY08216 [Lamprigera yunnana]|nr:hypothetical protein FQA39_LY08216 [Lamprigera yunnana]
MFQQVQVLTIFSVLLLFTLQVDSVKLDDDYFDEVLLQCMKVLNLDKTYVESYIDDDFHIRRRDKNFDELLICENGVYGYLNGKGELNLEMAKILIRDYYLPLLKKDHFDGTEDEVIEKCKHLKGESDPDRIVYLNNFLLSRQVDSVELLDEFFNDVALECMSKLNVNKNDVENYFDDDLHIRRRSKQMDDLFTCENIGIGYINDEGELSVELTKRLIKEYFLPLLKKDHFDGIEDEIIEKCDNLKDKSIADRLVHLQNCMIDELK